MALETYGSFAMDETSFFIPGLQYIIVLNGVEYPAECVANSSGSVIESYVLEAKQNGQTAISIIRYLNSGATSHTDASVEIDRSIIDVDETSCDITIKERQPLGYRPIWARAEGEDGIKVDIVTALQMIQNPSSFWSGATDCEIADHQETGR